MQNYSLTFPTYFRVAQISLRHHNSAPYMISQDGGNSQGFFCVYSSLSDWASLFGLSALEGRVDHNARPGVSGVGSVGYFHSCKWKTRYAQTVPFAGITPPAPIPRLLGLCCMSSHPSKSDSRSCRKQIFHICFFAWCSVRRIYVMSSDAKDAKACYTKAGVRAAPIKYGVFLFVQWS